MGNGAGRLWVDGPEIIGIYFTLTCGEEVRARSKKNVEIHHQLQENAFSEC